MSPCRSLTGLSCTAQIATAANKLKDDLARCELNLKAELGECQTQNEIEGLALQSWLQNIETRIQGAAVGVMGRLASLESAHEASKHETREMCEAVGTACVERALQVADSKFSDLEQDMNEICEENVTRLEDLEHAGAQLEETVHHTIGRVSQLEERATGAEKTLQRQAVDAARANIMAETSLSLMELDLDEKMNVLDTSMQHRIGTEISGVRERLDAERDEQLRSSKALRRLQKLMSRPDAGEIFRSFDTDGDGTINRSELQDGFAKIGEPLDDADMHALMALVDGDGDGNVDYKEFEQMSKMSEKMVEMASAASVEREKLMLLVETTREDLTNMLDSKCADVVESTAHSVDQLHSTVDSISGRVEEKVEAEVQEMRAALSGQSLLLKQLRQGIETHTEALDLVQYHVDLVHRQLSEADIANMTESIILRAAQVRHEERSAKVLHAANTALQEVHRHTESLVALQEDVGHDRATHEKAFSALHSQIVHLSACLDDAEVHINLDLALIHAATSRQSEQIFGLQARVDTIQMKAVEGDVQCEWLQEQISTNEMTATQAIEKVQGNVERVYRSLNDAEVNLLAELSIAQAGVSRSFEQISAVRQISAAQTSAVAESCETSRALNKSELASLARVIRASISAVQVTSDHKAHTYCSPPTPTAHRPQFHVVFAADG